MLSGRGCPTDPLLIPPKPSEEALLSRPHSHTDSSSEFKWISLSRIVNRRQTQDLQSDLTLNPGLALLPCDHREVYVSHGLHRGTRPEKRNLKPPAFSKKTQSGSKSRDTRGPSGPAGDCRPISIGRCCDWSLLCSA